MVAACDIYQPKNSSLSFLVVGHLLRLQLMTFIDLRIEVTQSFVIFRPLRASDHLVGQQLSLWCHRFKYVLKKRSSTHKIVKWKTANLIFKCLSSGSICYLPFETICEEKLIFKCWPKIMNKGNSVHALMVVIGRVGFWSFDHMFQTCQATKKSHSFILASCWLR